MQKRFAYGSLAVLTIVNLLNYLDRSIAPAIMPAIQKDLGLTDTQVGLLGTCFILVYFLASPFFGWWGDRGSRPRGMALGVAIWSLATGAAGWTRSYVQLLFARAAVGIGEAAYGAISPPLIGDLFPKEKRGRVFALFFMAMPVGVALGYLLGGMLEARFGWRYAFFLAGFPGLITAILLWFMRDPPRGQFDDASQHVGKDLSQRQIYSALARNPSYAFTVLGYAAYTFVVGALMVWIPMYLVRFLNISLEKGNTTFGAITVVTGFLATYVGGVWGDRWAKKSPDAYLRLSALSMFLGAPVFWFLLHENDFTRFACGLFILEFFVFVSTSPVNAQIVSCVPVFYRATANAVSIFAIHILGDALSPTLVGVLSDRSDLRTALYVCPIGFFLAGLIWFAKVIFYSDAMPWPSGALKLPRLQCHRGYRPEGIQENTLKAFRLAHSNGAEMVELDVRLSADGVAVVVHDADLKRVAGTPERVDSLSAAELNSGADVPTLAEILRDRHCPQRVNVELKSESLKDSRLERAVVRAVIESGAESRVLFSSFNPFSLGRMAKLLPDVPRALLVTQENDPKNRWYLRRMLLAWVAKPHMLNLDKEMYDARLAAHLKARGIRVAIWTVNDAVAARNCLALGAESIISDQPRLLG